MPQALVSAVGADIDARKTIAGLTLAMLMLAGGGCATPRDSYNPREFHAFMHDAPLAEQVATSRPASMPVASTTQSQRAQPATRPSVVTLTQVIEECIEHNLAIRGAAESIEQAKADLLTARLYPNPQLTVDSTLQPFGHISPEHPGGPPQYDAAMIYPIDWLIFGKRSAGIEVARYGMDAAAADKAEQIRQSVAAAIAAYYDVLEAKSSLALARADLDQAERVEEITKNRIERGGAGTIELDRVRLTNLDARREATKQEANLTSAKLALMALLGRSGPDPRFDVAGELAMPTAMSALDLPKLRVLAGQHRPDVISLRSQFEKALADVRNQKAQAWPQVSIAGTYSYQYQEPIGADNISLWSVALTLTLPIFDRNQGNIRKAHATARQALLKLSAQQLQVNVEVEQTLAAFRAAETTLIKHDRILAESARNVRDKIQAAYNVGDRSLLEMLDAQRAYRDAVRWQLADQLAYWRALHKLNAAVGMSVQACKTVGERDKCHVCGSWCVVCSGKERQQTTNNIQQTHEEQDAYAA